jgi:beta-N-acetylhexosaminidase
MAGSMKGAGMIMGAVPRFNADTALVAYAKAGLRAFLFPGALLMEPDLLINLATEARRLVFEAGGGPALLALGGWSEASATYPLLADLPSPLGLAAAGDRHAAGMAGFLLGRAVAGAGMDMVIGPRLDLATDPKARAGILDLFGEDPRLAAHLGVAFCRGLSRGGVAACALSFPGGGTVVSDVRHGPLSLPLSAERLEEAELRPFARCIKAGLPAVLVARAYVPALEPERIPAARSSLVIEGRLRSALGFKGLVLGDAVDGDPEGPARAALLGAIAGADLSLTVGPGAALEAAEALDRAARDGELPAPRLAIQARRVDGLLAGLVPVPRRTRALPIYASPLVASFSARVAERTATILRGRGRQGGAHADTPFVTSTKGLPVLIFFAPDKAVDARHRGAVTAALADELPGARVFSLHADPSEDEALRVLAEMMDGGGEGAGAGAPAGGAAAPTGEVLVLSCDAHLRPAQESFIHVLEESFGHVSLIALRDPYDAAFFPRAAAIGAVYGDSEAAVRAAARLATGRIEARGSCPVSVLGLEV